MVKFIINTDYMKCLYRSYFEAKRLVQSERSTIDYLDTVNDTKYLSLFKKGEITGEEVANKNHGDGLMYCVIVLEDDGTPFCALDIVHENEFIGVNFLDNVGREYLTYHFCEVDPMKRLFLEEVWYTFYPNSEAKDGNYRLHFVFDQDGNAAYRKYDDLEHKTYDYETKEPLDVTGLYEDYPKFGHYDGLIRLERNISLLNDMINPQ